MLSSTTKKRKASRSITPVAQQFKHVKDAVSSPATAPIIQVGSYRLTVGDRLRPLVDSTALYAAGQWRALFDRLDEDGVLLVRGVIGRKTIVRARGRVLQHLREKGALDEDDGSDDMRARIKKAPSGERIKGWTIDADSGGVNGDREDDSAVEGWRSVGTSSEVLAVYDGDELHSFYRGLFTAAHDAQRISCAAPQPFTSFPDCTWLRIRGHGDDTTEHTDYYFFKSDRTIFSDHFPAPPPPAALPGADGCCSVCSSPRDPDKTLLCDLCDAACHTYCHQPALPSSRLPKGEYHCVRCANLPFPFYTCWIALGTVAQQHGRLAVVPGSHRLQGYEARGRGESKLPRQWKARGGPEATAVWRSSDMEAGDIILFNVKTVHAASKNDSDDFRISVDTRVTYAQGDGWRRRQQPEQRHDRGRTAGMR